MNSQCMSCLPPDLYEKLRDIGAEADMTWQKAARAALEIGCLAIKQLGGIKKAGPIPPAPKAAHAASAKLPRTYALRLEKMAKEEGFSWQDAQRLALTLGIYGIEGQGGLRAYFDAVENAKAGIYQEARERHHTAA